MDSDMRIWLDKIEKSIAVGNAGLGAKMDLANQQFNDHLIKDTTDFTTLKIGQAAIETKLEGAERRRKEESDRAIKRQEEERVKKVTMRGVWIAGWFAILAALLATLLGSILTYIEAKAAREERAQERQQMKVQKP